MPRIKHYYASSNSSLGFYSLYEDVLRNLQHLSILKGGPGTGKATLIHHVGDTLAEDGWSVEFIHSPLENGSLDGVIFPDLKAGIVNGAAPYNFDPRYPGVVDRIVNIGDCCDEKQLMLNKTDIVRLTDEINEHMKTAYGIFATAKQGHDELESLYLSAMDFKKADKVANDLIETIFSASVEREKHPNVRTLFFGAATPNGPVDFIDHITEDVGKRYIVKGSAGSGKSVMMKKIGRHAEDRGFSVEYYQCAFDPNSTDMVLIPDLNVAICDGTDPHAVDPSRSGDEIVDMFERCMDPAVEMDRAEDIREAHTSYKYSMKRATQCLSEAQKKRAELATFYTRATDFHAVEKRKDEIITDILCLNGANRS